jgi:hypothetical protein
VSWGYQNQIHVFYAGGSDRSLHHMYFVDWFVYGPEYMGGYLPSAKAPAVVAPADLILFVVVRDGGGGLSYRQYDGAWARTGWSWWKSLSMPATSEPSANAGPNGTVDVFVRGGDYAPHTRNWNFFSSDPDGWSPDRSLGGYMTSSPGSVLMPDNASAVFVRGGDYRLYKVSV